MCVCALLKALQNVTDLNNINLLPLCQPVSTLTWSFCKDRDIYTVRRTNTERHNRDTEREIELKFQEMNVIFLVLVIEFYVSPLIQEDFSVLN